MPTPEDILAFLADNPTFLAQHPEALDGQTLASTKKEKGVADFQSFMIKRLQSDKAEMESATQTILEGARNNMNNQHRIHAAVLRLLEAHNFEDFIHTITLDLAGMLDVDIAALIIEADGNSIPHIHNTGLRIIPEGTIDGWMEGAPALLQDDISGIEPIYGGGATLVRSQILLRIDIALDTPPAVLAFGSRAPDTFQPGQATDQILFLARVIERCMRSWLHLPQK